MASREPSAVVRLLEEIHWQMAHEFQHPVAVQVGLIVGVVAPLGVFDDFDRHMLAPIARTAAPRYADHLITGISIEWIHTTC